MNEYLKQTIEKEIIIADKYFENLCNLSGWRLPQIFIQTKNCRASINKCLNLLGITGKWYYDIWLYINNSLPWFLPSIILALPTLSILAIFNKFFSYLTKLLTDKIIDYKYVYTETREEHIFTPDTIEITHDKIYYPKDILPSELLVSSLMGIIILIIILIISYLFKAIFMFELKHRKKLLLDQLKKNS